MVSNNPRQTHQNWSQAMRRWAMEGQRRLPKALIEVPKRSCGFSCRTELLTNWHRTKRELVVLMISMFSLQRSLEPWKYVPSASLFVSNVHVNVRRMTMFDSSFVGCCERGSDKNPKKTSQHCDTWPAGKPRTFYQSYN